MPRQEDQKCSLYDDEGLVFEDQLVSIERYAPGQGDGRVSWAGIYMRSASLEPEKVGAIYRLVTADGREGRLVMTRVLPSADHQWRWYRFDGIGELQTPLDEADS